MNITREQMLDWLYQAIAMKRRGDGLRVIADGQWNADMRSAIRSLIESSGETENKEPGAGPRIFPSVGQNPTLGGPSPGPSVEEGMTDEEGFRAIYALIEHAVNFAGGYFSTMTDQAMKGYFHFLRHPELKPAPLPAEVEAAMERMDFAIGDAYSARQDLTTQKGYTRAKAKEDCDMDHAALAVIRAALTATIKPPLTVTQTTKVTREWVSWFVKTLFDMKMRGVTFPVEGAAETMLQSVGIEVEP